MKVWLYVACRRANYGRNFRKKSDMNQASFCLACQEIAAKPQSKRELGV